MAHIAHIRDQGQGESAERLKSILLRLNMDAKTLQAGPRESSGDGASLILRVAQEIDETILPRRIDIVADGRVAATLVASNRRLLALQTEPPTPLPDSDSPEAVTQAYARVLLQIAAQAGHTELRRHGRATGATTNHSSCSAAQLAAFAADTSPEQPLKRFLNDIGSHAHAWLAIADDGARTSFGGQDQYRAQLTALEQFTAQSRGKKTGLRHLRRSGPTCTVLALSPGLRAIIASDADERILLAVPEDHTARVLSKWQQIHRTGAGCNSA